MNEITTTNNPFTPTTFDQVKELAQHIADAGIFGLKKPAQAITAMMLAHEEGKSLSQLMREIHFHEDGKVSQRADYTQAEFEKIHSIIWHIRTDEEVCGTFVLGKGVTDEQRGRGMQRYELLQELEDLKWSEPRTPAKETAVKKKIAALAREGEETVLRTLKDADFRGISQGSKGTKSNWQSSPRSMLQWRCATEGVKVIDPSRFSGRPSEVELQDAKVIEAAATVKMLANPKPENKDDMMRMLAGIDFELKTATGDERKKLFGDRSYISCKLQEIGTLTPDAPAEPAPTVLGRPAKNVTPIETPKPAPVDQQKVPQKPAETLPPAAKLTWQEVVCHVGGPTAKGKTLAFLFAPTRSAKAMKSIVDWFAGIDQDELSAEDKAKMPALLAAAAEGHAAWKRAQNIGPSDTSTPNPPNPAEAPQQPATSQDWREFVIESKDATLNGLKMKDLSSAQMKIIGDWLAKVDMKSATIYQRKLASMYALSTASGTTTELPSHVRQLDAKLRESQIEPEVFLREMKNIGLVAESYTSMADISEPETREMLGDWKSVEQACDVIDVEATKA